MLYNPGEIAAFTDLTLPEWERGARQGGNMNIAYMTRNLLDFKAVMDRHGVGFILFFGTLLGAVRDGTFISYDSDVDVLVFWDDYLKFCRVREELKDMGFYIPQIKPLHDEHIIRDGEKIEVWWCGEVLNQIIYDNNIRFQKDLILPTTQLPFLGTSFLAPKEYEKILSLIYGPNWGVPNKTTKGCSYKAL